MGHFSAAAAVNVAGGSAVTSRLAQRPGRQTAASACGRGAVVKMAVAETDVAKRPSRSVTSLSRGALRALDFLVMGSRRLEGARDGRFN